MMIFCISFIIVDCTLNIDESGSYPLNFNIGQYNDPFSRRKDWYQRRVSQHRYSIHEENVDNGSHGDLTIAPLSNHTPSLHNRWWNK